MIDQTRETIRNDKRGYVPLYRAGMDCPGCGGRHWWIGVRSAECAVCGTAIALAPVPGKHAQPRYPAWSNRA